MNDKQLWRNWWSKKDMTVYNPYQDSPNQTALAFSENWKIINVLINNWIPSFPVSGDNKYKSLEIGCGRGTISKYLKRYWGFQTFTMDFLPEMGKYNENFVCGDVTKYFWPIKELSFDLIVSYGLFEHFNEIEQYSISLRPTTYYLKQNGFFIHYLALSGSDDIPRYKPWYEAKLDYIYVYPKWANRWTMKIAKKFCANPWICNKRWARGVFIVDKK